MAPKRWKSTALAAAMIAGSGVFALAQVPPPPLINPTSVPAAASDTPVDPQTLKTQDLTALKESLTRPSPPAGAATELSVQQHRDEAARRLLARPSPVITQYLLDTLQSPTTARDVKLAIVRAIAAESQSDPAFANPLLTLLGSDRILSDATARALVRFSANSIVRSKLIAFAQALNQPANIRVGAIRALGGIVSRDVARTLEDLSNDPKQGVLVQTAANDALVELLTGQPNNGRDADRWKQWDAANAVQKDDAWLAGVMAAREQTRSTQDQNEQVDELTQILDEQYQRADQASKFALVMRLLNAGDPHLRVIGIKRVVNEIINAAKFPPQAPKRLAEMVGDSDANVRLEAAKAIYDLNDISALDAILTQLAQETNLDAKLAQISVLERMRRLRALPELRQLLRDPSIKVAAAAVKAIRALAPTLLVEDPRLAREVAEDLWKIGAERANEPGGLAYQSASIEDIGLLHDRSRAKDLLDLLSLNRDDHIRSAALHALGSLSDRDTAFPIAQWLANEPMATVRVDALNALASTSTFESAADTLYRYMSPNTEPDATVREQAWQEFLSLLPSATNLEVLNRWASEFQKDPERRLPVLLALNDKLQHDNDWKDLADSRQNTGETYMNPKIGEPGKAAIQFEQALDYWQGQHIESQVTLQLVQQLLKALLAAKDYPKAVATGSKQIQHDRTQQTIVGAALWGEANRLTDEGLRDNDPVKMKDAVRLIDNALKMQPPLEDRYQNDLRQFQDQIAQRGKAGK